MFVFVFVQYVLLYFAIPGKRNARVVRCSMNKSTYWCFLCFLFLVGRSRRWKAKMHGCQWTIDVARIGVVVVRFAEMCLGLQLPRGTCESDK